MSPHDKFAIGMSLFVLFFVAGSLFIPSVAYREYFAHLNSRKEHTLVKVFGPVVFLFSIPYFYDQLVGFDSRPLSLGLQVVMGASAYAVLIDVGLFVYRQYGPPSKRPPSSKPGSK